jgi:hypothetical protein
MWLIRAALRQPVTVMVFVVAVGVRVLPGQFEVHDPARVLPADVLRRPPLDANPHREVEALQPIINGLWIGTGGFVFMSRPEIGLRIAEGRLGLV